MIRKEKFKDHIVIPDTNILWYKDKTKVVNPEFDSFWKRYAEDSNLQLAIPEVVKGEILFQQSTSAIKQMQKASACIGEICGITEYNYTLRMTAKKIREQVGKRFEKWKKLKKASVLGIPASNIDWERLIMDSIWRVPPFESDPKNPDNEKGFRDAIILETIMDFVKSNSAENLIAFICNDNILRDTTAKKLKHYDCFSVYKSLEDFESYLKLQHEELTDKFIKSILKKATLKFYNPKDLKSLAFKEALPRKIEERFEKYINDPKLSDDTNAMFSGLLSPEEKWTPGAGGKYWIGSSQFIKMEDKTIYHWNTETTYAKKYVRKAENLNVLASIALGGHERVLLIKFDVIWTSKVFSDGRFINPAIQDIKMKENKFIPLSPDIVKNYDLD